MNFRWFGRQVTFIGIAGVTVTWEKLLDGILITADPGYWRQHRETRKDSRIIQISAPYADLDVGK